MKGIFLMEWPLSKCCARRRRRASSSSPSLADLTGEFSLTGSSATLAAPGRPGVRHSSEPRKPSAGRFGAAPNGPSGSSDEDPYSLTPSGSSGSSGKGRPGEQSSRQDESRLVAQERKESTNELFREDSGHASGGSSGGGDKGGSSPSKSSGGKKSNGISGSGVRSRSGNGRMASKEKEYYGPQNWAKVTSAPHFS